MERRLEEAAREFDQALSQVKDPNPYGLERLRIVKQFLTSDELFHRVAELRPQDTSLWGVRGHLLAEQGSWKEAAASYKKRLELGGDGAGLWYYYAVALLAANDVDDYRNVCEEMLELFANVSDPQEAWFVAWTMAIVPDSVQDKQQALRIAEKAMSGLPNSFSRSWGYAGWLYRLGRLEESIASWEGVGKGNWEDIRVCFLAMAHHRLGNADQARQFADQANSKEAEWAKHEDWSRGAVSLQLLKEMNAVLAAPPDAKASEVNDAKSGTDRSEDAPKPAADHGDSDSANSDKANNPMDD